VLRRGLSKAFSWATGVMTAKSGTPLPQRPVSQTLETILLPHARTRWMLPSAASMTPATIESLLKEAMTGRSPRREQELYSLMESTWPRLMKNAAEVKDAVLALDWNLIDADAEDQIPGAKDLVQRARNGMKGDPFTDGQGWRATLSSLLDARIRGISIAEIEWEFRGGRKFPLAWLPKLTRDLPAWHYGWRTGPQGSSAGGPSENDGRLVLYPDATAQSGIEFPPNKFLVAISKSGKGHPSGTAMLRCLAWFWCASNFSQEWLLNFAQIFGQPFRWATYDATQEGLKDDLAAMMEAMGSAAYGVGPDGTKVEWHESSKSGADNPQAYVMKVADQACDLLILGQTLTGSVGDSGSRALGEVHQSVRGDIIDSTAEWLAELLNEQLIPMIISLNYGDLDEDSAFPYFQPAKKEKKDTKVIAETIKIILESGIPLLKDEVYEALDFSKVEAGAEAFGSPPKPTDPPPPDGALPAGSAQTLRRVLAKLPLDAREYFLARLDPSDLADP
jgi:phage gp29-like protein